MLTKKQRMHLENIFTERFGLITALSMLFFQKYLTIVLKKYIFKRKTTDSKIFEVK